MASTNFKLFDENKTNMMSDTEYNINTQRLNGVQAGIASSQLQNKTLYQTSLVAYSLAQIMMQNGYDANDSAAVSAFVSNMSNSLLQKVLDKATTNEAKGGTNNTKYITPATMKAAVDLFIENKQDKITGAASTITSNNLTVNRALISNSSGKVGVSAVTSTELGRLSGVTSNVQTQLNGKASKSYVGEKTYTKTLIHEFTLSNPSYMAKDSDFDYHAVILEISGVSTDSGGIYFASNQAPVYSSYKAETFHVIDFLAALSENSNTKFFGFFGQYAFSLVKNTTIYMGYSNTFSSLSVKVYGIKF